MLNDEQFTEEVRAGLRYATDGVTPADWLLTELGHRHAQRVRRTRLAFGAGSAVAIVGVTVLAVTVAGGLGQSRLEPAGSTQPATPATSATSATSTQPATSAAVQDTEEILQRARSAVASADEMIIHVKVDRFTVTDQMRPDSEHWVLGSAGRGRTLAYYGDDHADADVTIERRAGGTTVSESIVYERREVVISESPSPRVRLFEEVVAPGVAHPRDLLDRDGITATGRSDTIRDRTAFQLVSGGSRPWEIWVDAQTYLPVLVLTPETEVDYDLLPANQENLALLEHEIPSDFTVRNDGS